VIQSAIDGMLTSLDPHSGYLDPESFDDMRDQTRGEYGGLGIEVTSEDGVVKVISPMDGTPAFKAGIKAGDYITAVNGESVLGLSVTEAVKQMRGKPGEVVTLTIAREKADPFDVKLTREVIKPKNVVASWTATTSSSDRQLQREDHRRDRGCLRQAKAEEPEDQGLILDLRNNPGRPARPGGRRLRPVPRRRRDRLQRGPRPRDVERYNARPGDITGGLRWWC
jgi:carboxyl-terminal processing protease